MARGAAAGWTLEGASAGTAGDCPQTMVNGGGDGGGGEGAPPLAPAVPAPPPAA